MKQLTNKITVILFRISSIMYLNILILMTKRKTFQYCFLLFHAVDNFVDNEETTFYSLKYYISMYVYLFYDRA